MGSAKLFFVDDLNAVKAFELTAANHEMILDLNRCQHEVHTWGKVNQVSFDATKESMHILALTSGEVDNFHLLGVPFDHALRMKDAVTEIVASATWKLGAILRTAHFSMTQRSSSCTNRSCCRSWNTALSLYTTHAILFCNR